ncbi:PAS domain S-box protein [Faecalicatena contorta]|uniref:sigma-54 interaction domain-containing protein n=1 Tax=Faecalicatena contorta TaxID=39482 RepID=UPI00129D4096|nr:sigma 54-interacting transcriptional regulator [Faecalicatena contorta]MRM88552.1 PAS domain S-box protein [Faecalicatena contorta]
MSAILNAELLDVIIEFSFDGIYITDGDARTIKINSAYENITGLRKEDLLDKNMKDLVAGGIVSESGSLIAIKNKKPVTLYQEFKTGKRALITSSPVLDEAGQVTMVVTNVRDMTEIYCLKKEVAKSEEQKEKLEKEIDNLRDKLFDSDIVARDRRILSVLYLANRAAPLDVTVLLTGETGVGKEMFAKYIHQNSKRMKRPFVKVNCGAIPHDLIESELFGYEKGAFTGANKEGKPGLFEAADKGTIFLDEIGELPLNLQVKLLRVLQEGEIERIGSISPKKIDVRVISATNRDLAKMVESQDFREDLYYRLNVFPIVIPPLRERVDDIEPLIERFLTQFNKKYGMHKTFSRETAAIMKRYSWPGNIRELRNIVERVMIVSTEDCITADHLPVEVNQVQVKSGNIILDNVVDLKAHLEEIELVYIEHAMDKYGNVRDAAKSLGMTASTLVRKRKRN